MADQCVDTTRVQLADTMCFTEIIFNRTGEKLLKEQKLLKDSIITKSSTQQR